MRFLDGGSAALRRSYLYNAREERVATLDLSATTELWTPRGADNELLSEFRRQNFETGAPIVWSEDTIYANSQQIARTNPSGTQHLHLDHLGSTRLITGGASPTVAVAFLSYYPFGQNTVDPVPGGETLQFTGQERDDNGGGLTGDLDHMHARYYHPMFGRFLSVDPVLGTPADPQSWNRYAYVKNSPLSLVDPSGLDGDSPKLIKAFGLGAKRNVASFGPFSIRLNSAGRFSGKNSSGQTVSQDKFSISLIIREASQDGTLARNKEFTALMTHDHISTLWDGNRIEEASFDDYDFSLEEVKLEMTSTDGGGNSTETTASISETAWKFGLLGTEIELNPVFLGFGKEEEETEDKSKEKQQTDNEPDPR